MGWPDLAARLQVAGQRVLGEPVVYTAPGGAPVSTKVGGGTLTGVFSNASEAVVFALGGPEVISSRPQVVVRAADFAVAPVVDGTVTVRSVTWTVAEVRPDGEGDLHLMLNE